VSKSIDIDESGSIPCGTQISIAKVPLSDIEVKRKSGVTKGKTHGQKVVGAITSKTRDAATIKK
jgi:hypothetical protein